MNKKEATY